MTHQVDDATTDQLMTTPYKTTFYYQTYASETSNGYATKCKLKLKTRWELRQKKACQPNSYHSYKQEG